MPTGSPNALLRLAKHSDYQRVYAASRKQFARELSFFFALRPPTGPDGKPTRSLTPGPRIGLTAGKVLGKAVDRNRIKRRLRESIRRHATILAGAPVDVILHPRRTALTLEHPRLDREIAQIFRTIHTALQKPATPAQTFRPPQ